MHSVISQIRVIHLPRVSVRAQAAPLITALIHFPQSCSLYSPSSVFPSVRFTCCASSWLADEQTIVHTCAVALKTCSYCTRATCSFCKCAPVPAKRRAFAKKPTIVYTHTDLHTGSWYSEALPQPLRLPTIDEPQGTLHRRKCPSQHQSRTKNELLRLIFSFSSLQWISLSSQNPVNYFVKHESMKPHDKMICVQ